MASELQAVKAWGSAVALLSLLSFASSACDINNGSWHRSQYQNIYRCPLFQCPTANTTLLTRYFWKSPGCQPMFLQPSVLLPLMRNKVMLFVGDSLAKNLYASVVCRCLAQTQGFSLPPERFGYYTNRIFLGVRFPVFNATFIYVLSPFWVSQAQAPPGKYNGVRVDEADYVWTKVLSLTNYVVFAGGRGFLRPSTGFYKDNVYKMNMTTENALGNASKAIRDYIVKEAYPGVPLIFTFPPDHLGGVLDSMSSRVGCWGATKPMDATQFAYAERLNKAVGLRDRQFKVFKNSRFLIGDITKLSLWRPDGHPGASASAAPGSTRDCSHWCLPGIPDTWADVLFSLITNII